MNKVTPQHFKRLGFLIFLFLFSALGFSQGTETFTNIGSSASNYATRNWTGDNGKPWSATKARTDQTIDGKAITLANQSASTISTTISGGIGDLTITTQRKFGSTGTGTIKVSINGTSLVSTFPYGSTVQTNTISGINVSGDVVLELLNGNTSERVAIDNVTWTAFPAGNVGPIIANIELNPDANNIHSGDEVMVSADITDEDGVDSAQLNWGLSSGDLNNSIVMTLDTGDSYSTVDAIPALGNGTTVYYSITATDIDAESTTTTERSYTVEDPAPSITEITQTPSASAVTNSDTVSVSATITDADQVVSAELQWGTTSGNYPNTVNMSIVAGDNYKTDTDIPAQLDGTTVYYIIKASNNYPTTTTSAEYSYEVVNPRPDIDNIVQVPNADSVTSSDAVTVSADVLDNDPIASVILRWGIQSGILPNAINMSIDSGDTYTTDTEIPAQANGVTVYYEIEATDSNPIPAIKTSAEQSYTVNDPLVFGIPYENGLRNSIDMADAEAVGFTFTGTSIESGAGGYIKINTGNTIVSPAIDFSAYNDLTVAFQMSTFGGSSGQKLSIFVSNDNGATYDLVSTDDTPSSYSLFESTIDLSTYNSTQGRIKFEMTAGTNSIRFRDLYLYDGYVYFNNAWRPSSPEDIQNSNANIYVKNGTTFLNNASVNNITVDAGATLEIKRVLNIAGNVMNDGEIVFLSTADRTGELGPVDEGSHFLGNGFVTFHRYMSDHRAYRMVSSSVNTSNSIHDNWQEGANSNTDNPNPGFGTHITGTTTDQENGFDATLTGNSSMFTVNVEDQEFVPVSNTDVDTLEAGKAYMMFVRGDRGIDLSENTSHGSTILRASGELAHGISIQSFETTTAGQFVMFGNPYQSGVDINSVFENSTNINPNTYYVYDPTLGDFGSYVSVDLETGANVFGSEANQYLQVGQGAQVATLATGNSAVVFHQADKAPGHHTRTNATGNILAAANMLTVKLYTTERFDNGGAVHDGFVMIFDADNSNELTPMDAVKPFNFYENLGINHEGTYLSIERRAMPEEDEIYPLYSNGYQHDQYTLLLNVEGLEGTDFYLDDNFTGNSTLLSAGDTAYNFNIVANEPLSKATDRFSIRTAGRLGVNENTVSGIHLFPNPMNESTFYIASPKLNGDNVSVSVVDILGREVYNDNKSFSGNTVRVDLPQGLKSGIYMVSVSSKGEKQTMRIIKR